MLRRLALSVGILGLASAGPAASQLALPVPSPNASVSQTIGITKVEVSYSRPHVKGPSRKEERVIWGGLVPYGKVWRTGANAVTKISFDTDVMVEGKKLAAGTYGLFTIPEKTGWTVIFNSQSTGNPFEYDAAKDVLRVNVNPVSSAMTDQFTIGLSEVNPDSALLDLDWERLRIPVRITVDTNGLVLARARKAVAEAKPDDSETPLRAARYAFEHKLVPEEAEKWLEKSLAVKPGFSNLALKARVLADQGKKAEAITTAEKARAAGKAAEQKPPEEAITALQKSIAEWKGK